MRLLAVVAAALLPLASNAQPPLGDIMQALREVSSSDVRFTETRTSMLLKEPLETSGRLVWRRPDRLEKHVESPYGESTVIEGARVIVTKRGDKTGRTLSVASGPAQALVEALRATLAGDLAALERHFEVKASGTVGAWTLTLLPRDTGVAAYVTRIDIAGARGQPSRIEVLEASGDRTVTSLAGPLR